MLIASLLRFFGRGRGEALEGGFAVFQNLADSGWFLKIAYPSFNTSNEVMMTSDVNISIAGEIQVTVDYWLSTNYSLSTMTIHTAGDQLYEK